MSLDDEIRTAQRAGDRERLNALRARRGDKLTNRVWTTKDGKRIRVVDMEDSHLVNTIRYLRRRWARWEALGIRMNPPDKRCQALMKVLRKEATQRGLIEEADKESA